MNIHIVGNFDFFSPTATALRARGLTQSLLLSGHSVTVLDNRSSLFPSEVPHDDVIARHVTIESVDEYHRGPHSPIFMAVRGLFLGNVSAEHMRRSNSRPDIIILTSTHLGYLLRFQRISRKLNVPLVLDVVEWYEPEDLPGGRFGPYAIANEISMRCVTQKSDGFIVISSRLERHYKHAGGAVINVPPLFEAAAHLMEKWSAKDGRLHLCYAGDPGKKEALSLVLSALETLDKRGTNFVLHAVGITVEDLNAVPGARELRINNPETGRIRFYGKVPNFVARDLVSRSDFTLLLRPLRKANQYGFPSKLSESMAVGTPVVANEFSDLGQFLRDGEDSILLPKLEFNAVVQALERAADMTLERRRKMAEQAWKEARIRFSPAASSSRLSSFLEGLV